MTKYRKLVKEHVAEHWQEDKTVCDFCKRDVTEVPDSSWDNSEVELEAKIGATYPESDNRTGYRIDCCNDCFLTKVKPAIESLGVNWHEYDADDVSVNGYCQKYYEDAETKE